MTLQPQPIEGESRQAFAVFRAYVRQGEKRSIRSLACRLHRSVTLLGVWSKKHKWQSRVIALEAEAASRANAHAVEADRLAKERFAEEIKREKVAFIRRQISASEKVIARALEILMQPIKGCAPNDSAKLFSVGTAMASTALGLHSPLVQIAQPPIIFKQATWKPDVGSPARSFNEYMHYLDKWRDRMKSLGNGETQDT